MAQEASKVFRHVLPIQIRFNDVDKFGHVNNTIYFQFYDTAKTDYFAAVCKDVDWESVAIVVVKIEAEFLSQIKAGEHIAARTRVTKIGRQLAPSHLPIRWLEEVASHTRSVPLFVRKRNVVKSQT